MTKTAGLQGRKLALRAGAAMVLALSATQVRAQCANSPLDLSQVPPELRTIASQLNFGTVGTAAVSNVQSLISVLSTTNTISLSQNSGFIGAPANPASGQQGGGVWARGLYGTFDTTTTGSYTYGNLGGIFPPGGARCKTRTFQNYSGFQAGADIARLNIDGFNAHVGITAGYTESDARAGGPGVSGRAGFNSTFGGVYGALTKGTFFADAQLRWDFYQGQIGDPGSGIAGQRLDSRSASISANIGNQFPLADGFFVEPSAGVVYSQITVDPLLVPGNIFNVGGGFVPPLAIQVQDFDSLLGRASLRFGKNMIVGDYALQPFFTASVFHEFAGAVRTSISTGFGSFASEVGFPVNLSPLDSVVDVRSNRIGTYEQLAVGIAGQLLNTGWLGYTRFDYRLGDRVDGYQISGGLRYQFNPEAGPAALISKDAPAAVLPALAGPVNWTGLSAGASVGGVFGQTHATGQFFSAALNGLATQKVDPHTSGVLAGGQVGADYQVGNFVIGVAGDFHWTNARGGRACPGGFGFFLSCESNMDMMVMGTGRVGVTWERALFYAKAGAAFTEVREAIHDNTGGAPLIGGGIRFSDFAGTSRNHSLVGLALGAGVEFALTQNWSAKAEYMHYDFEEAPVRFPSNVVIANPRVARDGDLVRVGVNYRFNFAQPAVVAASY